MLEKYEKYVDADGRLIVILRTLCAMDEKHRLVPRTIDLLDVNAEREHSYPAQDVMKWISDGILIKINNIPKYETQH